MISRSLSIGLCLSMVLWAQEVDDVEQQAAKKDSILRAKTVQLNRQLKETLNKMKVSYKQEQASGEEGKLLSKERIILDYKTPNGKVIPVLLGFRAEEVDPKPEKEEKKKKKKKDEEGEEKAASKVGEEELNAGILLEVGITAYKDSRTEYASKIKPMMKLMPTPKVKLPGVKTRKPELIETSSELLIMVRADLEPVAISPDTLTEVLKALAIAAEQIEENVKKKLNQ
ncbi:MAG: hypothetical protein ABDH66_00435 [Bacteroidia bacterium]